MSGREDINERVASLEVSNTFHTESLVEISNTLKEVVKVQAMLANQREQIVKIVESVESMSKNMHEYDKRLNQYKFTLGEIEKDFDQLLVQFNETKSRSEQNARFVKTAGYVLTGILVPLVITVISRIL